MISFKKIFFLSLLFLNSTLISVAQSINLKNGLILVSPSVGMPIRETAARMLIEEIAKRSNILLKTTTTWSKTNQTTIALVLANDLQLFKKNIPAVTDKNGPEFKPEGFRIVTDANVIWIVGADARGIMFGTGYLLRQLQLAPEIAQLDSPINHASSPRYPIRGHQLGYRNTANSYDAWSVKQYEQYIRELVIFGTNSIENIPFDDGKNAPLFKIPASEMRIKMSEICQQYDVDYWVWTPITFELSNHEKREAELKIHEEFYRQCPRLDHVFVPGGDPGDNHPSEVLPFLKDLHQVLIKYHPKAKVWVSLQGFSVEQTDYFYDYLAKNNPDWLQGVVTGPGSPPISETRYRLPEKYQHRLYPDITHNVRCQFPVHNWDQAFALTLGREASNPRPYAFATIHQTYSPFIDGFVSYSDGCHDDVNKILLNTLGWNPQSEVQDILKDYTHFFFGKNVSEAAADGIVMLENNWKGPLIQNSSIEATYSFWKNLETNNPNLKDNWRWQMLLLRANYDTYTRRRLMYEQALEKQANNILANATKLDALQTALATMNKADSVKIAPEIRQKIEQLCADLYASIGLQTSVPKYNAKGFERGAILDFVDYPLNNRWWLTDEVKKINELSSDEVKLKRINEIGRWENPGEGSFYDNVSNVSKGPHVKTHSEDGTDVAWWQDGFSRTRLSSQLFQKCPILDYDNLQPNARYVIRVLGTGDALLRVDGKRLEPTLYNREPETLKEWIVPLELSQDGKLHISFDEPEESHLNWRKHSKVSDIWLLKQR